MSFRKITTPIDGVYIIEPQIATDNRGEFVKTFRSDFFTNMGIEFVPREEFFTISQDNVIRGMHFQVPPFAHQKLIYCPYGGIQDVLLDIRRDSPTYGKHLVVELSDINRQMVFVPVGIAHGFLCNMDNTCVVYKTDLEYNQEHDAGIRWDSFGYVWPGNYFIVSKRDTAHPTFQDFRTPF